MLSCILCLQKRKLMKRVMRIAKYDGDVMEFRFNV